MSELGDDFKALREISREKKKGNVTSSLNLLAAKGIPYEVLNYENHHTLVCGNIDYWPSTGKWRVRGSGKTGRGVRNLIRLKESDK